MCPGGQVIRPFAGDRHASWLAGVLELSVAAIGRDLHPAVVLDQADGLAYLQTAASQLRDLPATKVVEFLGVVNTYTTGLSPEFLGKVLGELQDFPKNGVGGRWLAGSLLTLPGSEETRPTSA